jgi:hypothetical protein
MYVSLCLLTTPKFGTLQNLLTDYFYSLLPLLSSSIGCFSAVMSLKVQRKSTTMSRSFFTGDICRYSHNGVPERKEDSSQSDGDG